MTQIVWIARHGNRLDFVQPEWFNTAPKRYDPPLSDDGVIQAQELAVRMQSTKITHIFASPFLRTIQTAFEVAKVLNLPIKIEAGLAEWFNPDWMSETPETHSREWLSEQYPLIDCNYQSFCQPQYPETRAQLLQRTAKTVKHLVEEFSQDILLVGHGGSVFGMTKGLVPEVETFKVPLCSLTKVVRQQGNWQTDLIADTSHLSQTEKTIRLN